MTKWIFKPFVPLIAFGSIKRDISSEPPPAAMAARRSTVNDGRSDGRAIFKAMTSKKKWL